MKRARPARGFILILVLVIVMLASMVAASLLFMLGAEQTASTAGLNGEQAWTVAMSGVYQAMRIMSAAQPGTVDWRDNAGVFKDQLALDDGFVKWYFSVYSFGETDDPSGIRYGLTDEASKININRADEAALEALPNVTAPVAQAIRTFLDPNAAASLANTNATEVDASVVSYNIPNHTLSSLDDLLLISGVSPTVLYGEDVNFNGRLDPNEDDGDAIWPPDNQDGQLDTGLSQFTTVMSYDLNVDNDGQARLDLNDTNTDLTTLGLPDSVVAYVKAMQLSKKRINHPAELLEATGKFTNEMGTNQVLQSGVGKAELPILLDHCTTTNQNRLVGLVNILTAPAKVLVGLPGVDQALAESIVSARVGLGDDAKRTPAWLYQEGLVNADTFKKLAPYLTTRSSQFRFHVVAYALPSGAPRVLEAVIDMAVKPPAILSLKDMTRFGLPFTITGPSDTGQPNNSPITTARVRPSTGVKESFALSMERGLRMAGTPTVGGVPFPSPQPSPAGRGSDHVRTVAWLDTPDFNLNPNPGLWSRCLVRRSLGIALNQGLASRGRASSPWPSPPEKERDGVWTFQEFFGPGIVLAQITRVASLFGIAGRSWGIAPGCGHTSISFPITPALSLGEREDRRTSWDQSGALEYAPCEHQLGAGETSKQRQMVLPLPWGEGRGEGEGGVRSIVAVGTGRSRVTPLKSAPKMSKLQPSPPEEERGNGRKATIGSGFLSIGKLEIGFHVRFVGAKEMEATRG